MSLETVPNTSPSISTQASVVLPDPPAEEPPRRGLPPGRGVLPAVKEVITHRQILSNFVRRDFAAQHRNSFLGFLWSLLNPLFLVAVFTLVFKVLRAAPQGKEGAPFALFFFTGLTIWNLFSNSVQASTNSIVSSRHLIQKVYFPREILPLSIVLSNAITFLFESIVLVAGVSIFYKLPGLKAPLAALPVVTIMILAYGVGLILATINVFFRDVEHFVSIIMLAWFWFSGVIVDPSWVKAHGTTSYFLFSLNPVVGLVDSFRRLLLYNAWPDWTLFGYSVAVSVSSLILGMLIFNRFERAFAELV